jgi:sporulation protein YqfC
VRKNRHLQRIAGFFEFPEDIILDLPRITMLGNKQLLVENHKGIMEYTPSLVRVKLKQGELKVTGQRLVLESLQAEQLLVAGIVEEVCYDI